MGWDLDEEERWVQAAQDGDLVAFGRLAAHFRPGLVVLCSQYLQPEEAKDVAQETLLTAFRALPGLNDVGRFRAWIGAIARRLCLRAKSRQTPNLPLNDLIVAYVPQIIEDLARRERATNITKCIRQLPVDIRAAAELYYLHEWTAREISEFLTVPLATVKWRLHTGRTMLRQRLDASREEFFYGK